MIRPAARCIIAGMRNSTNNPAPLKRFYATLALKGLHLAEMARRCGVSNAHLRAVILGERRPSERLALTLQAEVGQQGWAFVSGQVDVLAMPGTSTAGNLPQQAERFSAEVADDRP